MSKTLADYGITAKRATAEELRAILVTVECGLAGPHVTTLLCHIAALTAERDSLDHEARTLRDGAKTHPFGPDWENLI